jgi:hypothetical protein
MLPIRRWFGLAEEAEGTAQVVGRLVVVQRGGVVLFAQFLRSVMTGRWQ